jgi:hypothetical protein
VVETIPLLLTVTRHLDPLGDFNITPALDDVTSISPELLTVPETSRVDEGLFVPTPNLVLMK